MTAPLPYIVHDRVRWADVDQVAIMRFSAFTRLVEVAEQELLRAAGLPYSVLFDHPRVWMPRRRLEIDYFTPARIDDPLSLVTYVTRMGDTSLTMQVDVRHATRGTLIAAITMVVVCVTVDTFEKRPLPRSSREGLAPFLLSVEEARAGAPERR